MAAPTMRAVFRRGVASMKESVKVAPKNDPSFRRGNDDFFLGKRFMDLKQKAHGYGAKPSYQYGPLAPTDIFFCLLYFGPLYVYLSGVHLRGSKA